MTRPKLHRNRFDEIIAQSMIEPAADDPEPELSPDDAPVHWRCPTCGEPCACIGIVRLAQHVPCGTPPP